MSYNIDRKLLPPLVNEHINDLVVIKGCNKSTTEGYITDLWLFFRYLTAMNIGLSSPADLEKNFDMSFIDADFISKISLKDVNEFLAYCNNDRYNSATTRARKASAIRGFFKYVADKMNYIDKNPVSQLQVASPKKKLPKYLTLEESRALLAAVDGENRIRDYCILTLFLNCGLRLAELVNLNITDINFDEEKMLVTGKGDKQRMIYLNNACLSALKDYLSVRPHNQLKGNDRNALFISRLNKRMGRQAVQLMVYHYLEKIGLNGQHYSVHKLRHTAATLMYQHGDADVLLLKEMLGHENLSTTEIYTHIENKQLREAVKNNPLSNDNHN